LKIRHGAIVGMPSLTMTGCEMKRP